MVYRGQNGTYSEVRVFEAEEGGDCDGVVREARSLSPSFCDDCCFTVRPLVFV